MGEIESLKLFSAHSLQLAPTESHNLMAFPLQLNRLRDHDQGHFPSHLAQAQRQGSALASRVDLPVQAA
jgi:hypothetical protein